MAYPLITNHKTKGPLCQLSFDDLNTIGNMLNGLTIVMDPNRTSAEFIAPDQSGKNWKLLLPAQAVSVPTPPESGDYVLTSQNGGLSWVALETFVCPVPES